MSKPLTPKQRQLIATVRARGGEKDGAEYWPVVHDCARDGVAVKSFELRSINRAVETLIARGDLTFDADGLLRIADGGE
jgi:hypothetical protein